MRRFHWGFWLVEGFVVSGAVAQGVILGMAIQAATPSGAMVNYPIVNPKMAASRGDQTPFIARNPLAAAAKAIAGARYRVNFGAAKEDDQARKEAESFEPIALVMREDDRGLPLWSVKIDWDKSFVRTTGRTSADRRPIDIAGFDMRHAGLLRSNYPQVVRIAQAFNAGDLVEAIYADKTSKEHPAGTPEVIPGIMMAGSQLQLIYFYPSRLLD